MTAKRRQSDSPAVAEARRELQAVARDLRVAVKRLKDVRAGLDEAAKTGRALPGRHVPKHTVEAWAAGAVTNLLDGGLAFSGLEPLARAVAGEAVEDWWALLEESVREPDAGAQE